jgi:hypothetical protein
VSLLCDLEQFWPVAGGNKLQTPQQYDSTRDGIPRIGRCSNRGLGNFEGMEIRNKVLADCNPHLKRREWDYLKQYAYTIHAQICSYTFHWDKRNFRAARSANVHLWTDSGVPFIHDVR